MGDRIRIQGVRLKGTPGKMKVTAELIWRDQVFVGEAEEEGADALRLGAMATVHAINQLLPAGYRLSLEGIEVIRLKQNDAVVVHVTFHRREEQEDLVGSTFIRGRHPTEVGAEAIIEASERRIGIVLPTGRSQNQDTEGTIGSQGVAGLLPTVRDSLGTSLEAPES